MINNGQIEDKKFFFGKYKGRGFVDVAINDPGYVDWMLGSGLLKGNSRELLLEAVEIAKLNESRK